MILATGSTAAAITIVLTSAGAASLVVAGAWMLIWAGARLRRGPGPGSRPERLLREKEQARKARDLAAEALADSHLAAEQSRADMAPDYRLDGERP